MQVFKLFNRIVLKNKSSFLMYFAVVLGITLLFVSGGGAGVTGGFQGNSVRLAADNRDNGPLSNALVDYLAGKTTLVPMPGDEEALRESLFFEPCGNIFGPFYGGCVFFFSCGNAAGPDRVKV